MQIPDEIRLGIELFGLFSMGGTILLKLGRMGERFEQHSKKIDKMEATLEIVAVQKDQIQSIREAIASNTNRTDETFKRVFTILDRSWVTSQ